MFLINFLISENKIKPVENLEVEIDKIISKPIKERGDLAYRLLIESRSSINKDFFIRLWNVYDRSMRVQYKLNQKINIPVTLITAKTPLIPAMSSDLGWGKYYNNIKEVIKASGDHLSVVQKPNCSKWFLETRLKEEVSNT